MEDKKIRGIMQAGAGGYGNAGTRIQNYVIEEGLYAWGGYPDMDDLFIQQAGELDSKRREALLHQIPRLAHERVMFAALWELGFLNAIGPRVEEPGQRLHRGSDARHSRGGFTWLRRKTFSTTT